MAVFFVNSCKFANCGLTFQSLSDLIRHIEFTHLDYESPKLDQKLKPDQSRCLPVSCVLRMFQSNDSMTNPTPITPGPNYNSRGKRPLSPATSLGSTATPNGSELDEENGSESAESTDSWMKNPDSAATLLKMMSSNPGIDPKLDKPFLCPVNGCKKRYRNSSGLSCHNKNTHSNNNNNDQSSETPKPEEKKYVCFCGKLYKTAHGMRHHKVTHHKSEMEAMTQNNSQSINDTITSVTSNSKSSDNVSNTFTEPATPINATSSSIQTIKDQKSALANYVRNKNSTLKSCTMTPPGAPPSPALQQFEMCHQQQLSTSPKVSLPIMSKPQNNTLMTTLPKISAGTSTNNNNTTSKVVPLAGIPGATIKAPMLQQHLMSPLKPLKNTINTAAITGSIGK